MFIPNREELAWAAGFFDGEGSVSILLKDDWFNSLMITITQAEPTTLERFREAVARLGYVRGPYERRSEQHQPRWVYTVARFEDIQAIMVMLWPFLSGPKRLDTVRALSAYAARPDKRRKRKPTIAEMEEALRLEGKFP
jgi:hypothetical protein